MVFEISTSKQEILEKLTERDWTPTDLAEDLGKSPNTVYNHLNQLYTQGVLTKTQVAAKTRPKTEYSIGDGFLQYVAVLPGLFSERTLDLTPEKQAVLRIWDIPQEVFHPFVEDFWWGIKHSADLDYREDIEAIAVYGSVARGEADEDSDIDFLVITADSDVETFVTEYLGSLQITFADERKIAMTEAYTLTEYRNSLSHGSDFLDNILEELHVIYDPNAILRKPEEVTNE